MTHWAAAMIHGFTWCTELDRTFDGRKSEKIVEAYLLQGMSHCFVTRRVVLRLKKRRVVSPTSDSIKPCLDLGHIKHMTHSVET